MLFTKNGSSIKRVFKLIVKGIGLLILIANFFSCNNSDSTHTSSADYSRVLDSASRTYDGGDPQKAMRYLALTKNKYRDVDLHQWFLYFTYHFNYYYFIQADHDTAMLYADSMLNLFDTPEKKLKYTSEYGLAHFYKGDVLFDENKYDEAYQYYYQGRLIASNNVDDCTYSDYDYRLGMIMYKQEHYKAGATYFKMGSAQVNKCDMTFRSFLRRQELYNNTGLCYSKQDMGDSALIYFNIGLKFIDSAGARFAGNANDLAVDRAVIYGNEANIYVKRNNYPVAESLLKKSIATNLIRYNDNRDAQLSEMKLAHLYMLQNKSDSLIQLLQAVKLQFDSVKNTVAEADWSLLMAKYYIGQKQPKIAFGYMIKHDALKDSVAEGNKQLKEADINQQMDALKKNYEFKQLKKNNQQQHYYLDIAIVLGLMLFIIISLIFLNWQKSKENVNILGGLNKQINDQNRNLEQALDQLKLNSEEKDRILRTVAHDLRTPVGGIAALTGLMAEESEYTAEQKELISLIKETSNNSLELINEILEVTDNSQAKTQKEKEPVEINSLVSKSAELLRFKASEKSQQIILHLMDKPIELLISREKIWRVISNLISNAVKFSYKNTLINVTVSNEDGNIIIAVADKGIGVPDNMKDKIFNTFTDAKRPGTAGEQSFGLGLSICYQIIQNHDGKIWLESSGDGTTFYVSLPVT